MKQDNVSSQFMRTTVIILLLCITSALYSQTSYKAGDRTGDIRVNRILNYEGSIQSLAAFKKKLIIVDFFGTWCKPCLNALPHLYDLQRQFDNDIQIVLVSTEDEAHLKDFIAARKQFSLPVIVDNDQGFTKLFAPRSYPYTVVLRNNKMIAAPNTAALNEINIRAWLEDAVAPADTNASQPLTETKTIASSTMEVITQSDKGPLKLSEDFIYAAKTNQPLSQLQKRLNDLSFDSLLIALNTDQKKTAFWINLYNGFTQVLLRNNPDLYKDRRKFFSAKLINVAGRNFSLDKIEHGILRHSKIKWSLGYVNKLFVGKDERWLRVNNRDARIHFALNCGAKSCPPIAFYTADRLDQQLTAATKSYLSTEAEYDSVTNTVHLPAIMGWFRGDFGGKKGMRKLLEQHEIIPKASSPRIRFRKYNWELFLNNFKNQ